MSEVLNGLWRRLTQPPDPDTHGRQSRCTSTEAEPDSPCFRNTSQFPWGRWMTLCPAFPSVVSCVVEFSGSSWSSWSDSQETACTSWPPVHQEVLCYCVQIFHQPDCRPAGLQDRCISFQRRTSLFWLSNIWKVIVTSQGVHTSLTHIISIYSCFFLKLCLLCVQTIVIFPQETLIIS